MECRMCHFLKVLLRREYFTYGESFFCTDCRMRGWLVYKSEHNQQQVSIADARRH